MSRRILVAAVLLTSAGCPRRAPEPPAPHVVQGATAAAGVAPSTRAHAEPNPHGGGGEPRCQRCHDPDTSAVNTDPIALCAECHDAARMRHPFRIQAAEHVEGLPLMPDRVIACHTCHDPHDVKTRRSGLRTSFAELCMACHRRHAAPSGPSAAPAPQGHGDAKPE